MLTWIHCPVLHALRESPRFRTRVFTVTAYLRFPAAFPALEAAPNGVAAATGIALLLSALGFFFSRLPLDIGISCCTNSWPASDHIPLMAC